MVIKAEFGIWDLCNKKPRTHPWWSEEKEERCSKRVIVLVRKGRFLS